MPKPRKCKDCVSEGIETLRPAPQPGPRCETHHRQFVRAQKARNHNTMTQRVYGLSDGDYDRLYRSQGNRCAICQRATGAVKRLAVDHDHATGEVRGLLCGPCNRMLIGRYDLNALARAMNYLANPPARAILGTKEIS